MSNPKMNPSEVEQAVEQIKKLLREGAKAQKAGNTEKMKRAAGSALSHFQWMLGQGGKPPEWVTDALESALKSFGYAHEPLRHKTTKKCDYHSLSDGEIKKMKLNGHDPHDIKGFDSEADLFKCKQSGKVAIGRKSWHQDEDGNYVPGGDNYEDTCLNIDAMPWPKKGKRVSMMEEIIIEFRIGGLTKPILDVLDKLPLKPDKVYKKGEKRGSSILTHHEDWFAFRADAKDTRFDVAVAGLLEKLHPVRKELQKACGPHRAQLSCILYFDASHRPYVHFGSEALDQLKDLNAAIDVDLYPMSNDDK